MSQMIQCDDDGLCERCRVYHFPKPSNKTVWDTFAAANWHVYDPRFGLMSELDLLSYEEAPTRLLDEEVDDRVV